MVQYAYVNQLCEHVFWQVFEEKLPEEETWQMATQLCHHFVHEGGWPSVTQGLEMYQERGPFWFTEIECFNKSSSQCIIFVILWGIADKILQP